ncbi:hypothetical protein THAOC_26342, partial [Thalassiosira oceanica]
MMANIGRRCAKEVAEGCIPDQNRPPILILASAIAVDPTMSPTILASKSDSGDITGFENRQCSNGDLHATDSQVNSKYVQIDIGTLTDGLSPNIHRSMAIRRSIARSKCAPEARFCTAYTILNHVYTADGSLSRVADRDINTAIRWGAVKDGLLQRGYTLDRVSSHSLRAAGAMALKLNGCSGETIKRVGRWSSDTYLPHVHTYADR